MEMRIGIREIATFAARADEAAHIAERELRIAAYDAGALVLRSAQDLAPVDTGLLVSAIGPVEVRGGVREVTSLVPVGAQAPYAAAVEFGRGSVTIRPRYARALRFRAGGDTVFASRVTQPARRGRPFMGPALERETGNVLAAFRMAYQRLFAWWGEQAA
jgi:hypothetical protein